MQRQIEQAITDFDERKKLEEVKKQEEEEMIKEAQAAQGVVEKFDKSKHAGTVYDPVLQRRVPVTD